METGYTFNEFANKYPDAEFFTWTTGSYMPGYTHIRGVIPVETEDGVLLFAPTTYDTMQLIEIDPKEVIPMDQFKYKVGDKVFLKAKQNFQGMPWTIVLIEEGIVTLRDIDNLHKGKKALDIKHRLADIILYSRLKYTGNEVTNK